ncbi:hypothetical protein [Thalassotalea crassostreae]|uniref:hypothetical protein n=1 Tax=Thalassotalea crassostreae TaxID=1763536 RepID=UPI000837BF85|nr:hypothetical protein [Thalassotalea crassostreae]
MKKHIALLLIFGALTACGGGGGGGSTPTPPADTGVDIDVRTFNFVYQGGTTSDIIVNAIYDKFQSGQSTTTLHSNAVYGGIVENIIVSAIKDTSGKLNVSFELRNANTDALLAAEQESISSDELEQLVFAVGDSTLTSPEYEVEVFDRPLDQPSATSAPLYVINLFGKEDVNIFIDDALFQGALEAIELSNKYDVDLKSPLSKVSLEALNGTEIATCNVSNENFDDRQSLIIFAKNTSNSPACFITTY